MNLSTYRWPIAFALIAIAAGIIAFFVPSLVASSIVGGIAAVFFVLTLISAPTAIRASASNESEQQTMRTTLGDSK